MMTDLNYEVGVIKAQNESTREDINEMKESLSDLNNRLASIESQLLTWKSSIAGAVVILVTIGNIALYFGETFVNFVKVKLGL